MKEFIEVTDYNNRKLFINIHAIDYISSETTKNSSVSMYVTRNWVGIKESYEEVKALIGKAMK